MILERLTETDSLQTRVGNKTALYELKIYLLVCVCMYMYVILSLHILCFFSLFFSTSFITSVYDFPGPMCDLLWSDPQPQVSLFSNFTAMSLRVHINSFIFMNLQLIDFM